MKNLQTGLAAVVLAVCGARPAYAAYEDVGVSARVVGMGNAFTAVADDANAIYYNPAGLGFLNRPEVATTYSKLLTGLSDNSNLQNSFVGYAQPLDQGRQGALGLAWNYLTLDSLYHESSLFASYGRRVLPERLPNGLFLGGSLKYLSRGFGSLSAANNSYTNTGGTTGLPDSVLQSGGNSTVDVDLGALYRLRPSFNLGLAIQHVLEPNIAISNSDTDLLGRNIKLGAAYQTPWSVVSTDLDFLHSPVGTIDKVATLAFEKWLPTLLHGAFALRGSVGLGDRQYRQLTMGASYRIFRMQLDYGFAIPVGTIANTMGSHRFGLTFRFGRAPGVQEAPKLSEAVLEGMEGLAEQGTLAFRAQNENVARYLRTAQQEFLRQARIDAGEAHFAEAKEKVAQAAALNPTDKALAGTLERVSLVAGVYPDAPGFRTEAPMASLYLGILDFLSEKDQEAVRQLGYARSLSPADERLSALIKLVEEKTGLRAQAPAGALPAAPEAAPAVVVATAAPAAQPAPAAPVVAVATAAPALPTGEIDRDLSLSEVALWENNPDKAIELSRRVLEKDPNNALAYKRLARAYYVKRDYLKALEALENGSRLENDPEIRTSLRIYMDALKSLIERKTREAAAPPAPAKAAAAPSRRGGADPLTLRRLYEAGVDLYSQGRLSEALRQFQKILELDPDNKAAAQAQRRVQVEISEGGGQ